LMVLERELLLEPALTERVRLEPAVMPSAAESVRLASSMP